MALTELTPFGGTQPPATSTRWMILRTSGPRTLPLARGLAAAGYDVWTPTAVTRLPVRRGQKPRERELPIMPTFVFARERHAAELLFAAGDPASRLPSFSVFRRADRVPFVADRDVQALREEEAARAAALVAIREGETREERRRERIAQLHTERARRKAMRQQRLNMTAGTWIEVEGMPALAGLPGQIIEERGNAAVVCFGGALTMQIEAWRLVPNAVAGCSTDAA